MFKKLIIAATLLTMFPTAALAAQPPVPYSTPNHEILPYPQPQPQHYSVKPNDPLHLEGCRGEKAEGKGVVRFTDYNGYVYLYGKGLIWVRKEDGTKWEKSGFERVPGRGNWILFHGKGKFYAKSKSLDLRFIGKAMLKADGCGVSNYHGWWEVDVWRRFWRIPPPWPIPIPLPQTQSYFH